MRGVCYFNSYLHLSFHECLLTIILTNQQHGISEVDTINIFLASIGAEDDISFDAVKKASYRLRKKRDLPNFRDKFNLPNRLLVPNPANSTGLSDSVTKGMS